ncbi:potassium-transporting ATPase subunit KdpC [Streptococcus halichoeri]|uniref:potassium-transporting ATPase subunit KdpC n=1 Tax=Streptococcus halichoeri TaxID=254785 RepID=UPI001F46CA6E|nr:potassium-transporting ATPase subunit KdpC [Streptococcus halichoeri]
MIKKLFSHLKTPFLLTLVFGLICGFIYPVVVTAVGQVIFPHQARGSQVTYQGKVVGSALIGQDFSSDRFLHGRPSAIHYNTYNAKLKTVKVASGSQNLAPSNPALKSRVQHDLNAFLSQNKTIHKEALPADLVTSSGSGLDPEISPQSARLQIPRLARTTGLSTATLKGIIAQHTKGKLLGFIGEERVNVLAVNLELEARAK